MKGLSKINSKVLGSLIKIHRIQQNMSQKALSEGICVGSYLSKIENAEVIPTQELIMLLFDALGITYQESEEFLVEAREQVEEYIEKLTFSDFKSSNSLYHKIMSQGDWYIHSPLIIDYYLIQLARYCGTPGKSAFQEADRILNEVVELMDQRQQMLYCLYKGMDVLQLSENYEEGMRYLEKGMRCGENGHLFYWMAQGQVYQNKILKALKYAEKALEVYVKEANFNGMMCTYELLSKVFGCLDYNEESRFYLRKALKLCRRLDEGAFEAYLYYRLAWEALVRGDMDEAKKFLEKDRNEESLIPKLTTWEVKLFIAHKEGDTELLLKLLEEESDVEKFPHQGIVKIFKVYMKEDRRLKTSELEDYLCVGIKEVHRLFEVKSYLQNLLIQYYKYNRRYKEALEVYEEMMRK